jgi:hypothetical protein
MAGKNGKPAGPAWTEKLTVEIPGEVGVRLYAQARRMGVPKRELAGRLLDQGLRRFEADQGVRETLAGEGRG